jgi:hypothetical protein
MTPTDTGLRARALAAASAARFAGFFETAEALVKMANRCDCRIHLQDHPAYGHDTVSWCLENNLRHKMVQ